MTQAHGSNGRCVVATRRCATDSSVEQGLEVGNRRRGTRGRWKRHPPERDDRSNGEEAVDAVTRTCCWRGKHSEGWSVTRKARRRDEFPPLTPTFACTAGSGLAPPEPDLSGTGVTTKRTDRWTRSTERCDSRWKGRGLDSQNGTVGGDTHGEGTRARPAHRGATLAREAMRRRAGARVAPEPET